ncbi:biotin--[acetyl-CoA-carboxylase] ligase [Breoghania sp.]|uniref:biotin--[acetyl-CoA-carboxylase] ligase n=1 Tax=Breoghania sp. TaxID=2065378 RepID=UPI002638BCBA|nr:biotin--[acetyl-CoA-carboxylase] ligase [Breoghania sp.]MDJ0929695.1 biotin--[acetyl-CoA-carboxylase] ligase [Breoghania sp.]
MAPGYRRRHEQSVGSTNAEALNAARSGEPGGLWITADRQTAGRGRREHTWVSEKGNLYASLLLADPCEPERLGDLPMVCCVALADAVEALTGRIGLVSIKWPNDLLVEGAKISGILLESDTMTDGRLVVAAGFGVNCNHHLEAARYATIDLASLGYRVTPDDLFSRLAAALASRLEEWRGGEGFSAIRAVWLKRCVGIGAPVTVRLPDHDISGIFRALDEYGRLLLETGSGTMTISAGDLFFGNSAGRDEEST